MRCGHCKIYDIDVEHVRRCSRATYAPADFGLPVVEEVASLTAAADALKRHPVEEAGMYSPVSGVIYKVQKAVHGSGHLYAKELVIGEDGHATFTYAPGAMRLLAAEDRLTLEQAKEYGALYGTCIVCGRTLTDEHSIAAGIGPVCAGRV